MSKKLVSCNVGKYMDICELIWFKLCLMRDTIELYILILVLMTLIKGYRGVRKKKTKTNLPVISQKVFMDLV